jgi:hypothetical protein
MKDIDEIGISQLEAMNLLQSEGIISDNCIEIADIAFADLQPSITFLRNYYAAIRK